MAIRSKNTTKKPKKETAGIFLYIFAVFTLTVYSGLRIYAVWYYIPWGVTDILHNKIAFKILLGILLIFLCLYMHRYAKRNENTLTRHKLDTVPLEYVAAAVILSAFLLWRVQVTATNNGMLFGRIWIIGTWKIVLATLLVFLPLAAICTGTVTVLVRRILLDSVRNTSVCWQFAEKLIRKRKEEQTSLQWSEEVNRIGFGVITICFTGIVAGCIFMGKFSVFLFGVLLYAVYFYCYKKHNIYKDLKALSGQIEEVAEGNLNAPFIENEESPLYRDSQKLYEISGNLKKIMDNQLRAERMKVDLITNVSHDLKTPLTAMVGYIDLLKNEELSSEARDYVDVLAAKQEHLKQMIQDIFELSKSTSGTVQLELEELDLKKLLEQTLADMEEVIQKSEREIRKNDPEGTFKMIGDGKKLYRIFQNLLENALKYSLSGTRIYVEMGKEGGRIYVTIKNTSSYEMDFTPDQILERFARADESRNTEGHGLGLAIAESFTKNMGGEFQIGIDGDLFKVTVLFDALVN